MAYEHTISAEQPRLVAITNNPVPPMWSGQALLYYDRLAHFDRRRGCRVVDLRRVIPFETIYSAMRYRNSRVARVAVHSMLSLAQQLQQEHQPIVIEPDTDSSGDESMGEGSH